MSKKIDVMSPKSGRVYKEDDSVINVADIMAAVYDAVNGVLKTSSVIEVGDIEIGAVELKDAESDTRAKIGPNGLHVDLQAMDTVFQGNKTLTGAANQLVADRTCKNVTVQADPSNVGSVKLGTSAVDATNYMFILSPGSSMTFTIKNVNLLYALGTSGDKVSFGGEV